MDLNALTLGQLLAHKSPLVRRHAQGCLKALMGNDTRPGEELQDALERADRMRSIAHGFEGAGTAICRACLKEDEICAHCGLCNDCHISDH